MSRLATSKRSSSTRALSERGFTLLEILVTLMIVGLAVFGVLVIREQSINEYFEARNANIARTLASEMITELEFHELESRGGPIDGLPGFEFSIDVEEIDLVTGEGDPEAEKREQDKRAKRSGDYDPDTRFNPSDSVKPDDELQEFVYPVRKVKLTLLYPNLNVEAQEPRKLVVETILPPLPEAIEEHERKMNSPFQSDKK